MTWPRRSASFALALSLVLTACGGASETPSPAVSGTPSGSPPPATPRPVTEPPASGPATTTADRLEPDVVALVLTKGLRVRSKPGTSGKVAAKQLDAGYLVYIIEGPVEANGYSWLHVQPFGGFDPKLAVPSGWVASAAQDGTPWVAPATVPCPALPVDGPTLANVGAPTALACFRAQTLTFAARLVVPEAVCALQPGDPGIDPDWLDPCSSGDLRLAAATAPSRDGVTLGIVPDPAAALPADLLVPRRDPGSWPLLEVSGRYSHEAAATCKSAGSKAVDATRAAEIVFGCRLRFVLTKATPLG